MNRILTHAACAMLLLVAQAASAATPASALVAPAERTIVLVRHGNYVADPAADPQLGPGLSPLGIAQAHLVGARLSGSGLRFNALYASPLQRARETAAVIGEDFPGHRFRVIDDLAECTPPTRRASIMAGEPVDQLAACQAQLERVFAAYFKPAAGAPRSELFVCHGNVIRYLVVRALGVDPTSWLALSVGHASITTIHIAADGSMQVTSVGDVGHLPANLRTGSSADPARSLAVPAL